MRRGRAQPVVVEQLLELGRRLVEESGELDLLVADLGHVRERRRDVLLHLVANRVELDPDAAKLLRRGVA